MFSALACFRAASLEAEHLAVSCWIAIALAYASAGLQCLIGVRAHSTREMAPSWAWASGIAIGDICVAAGGLSPSTLTRIYNLDGFRPLNST